MVVANELRRLPQQVEPRAVQHLHAVGARVHSDVAEHELRVQPVAAFLEIAAVRHLREHVGRAEQVAGQAVARIADTDLVERHLVAGEVHDARRDRHPVCRDRPRAGTSQGSGRCASRGCA